MNIFSATPEVDLGAAIAFNTNFINIPGLLALDVKLRHASGGIQVDGQASLAVLVFSELESADDVGFLSAQDNLSLTAWSLPKLRESKCEFYVLNNPLLTVFDIPVLESADEFTFTGNNAFASFTAPALASMSGAWSINNCLTLTTVLLPVLQHAAASLSIFSNAALQSIQMPLLQTVGGVMNLSGQPSLTGLTLTALQSINGNLNLNGCASLSSVSLPAFLPTNGKFITMTGCALSQASVDGILARAVANPSYVSGNINLSGGTNAAPGTQGVIDKAALIARGVTVTTN